ncbi:MAG TPA: hypothetical protein VEB21_20385 [Terriglobales bacterium]|nr:hypothetical protein [Terriglobales bacterium]
MTFLRAIRLALALALLASSFSPAFAGPALAEPMVVAQGERRGELSPRYHPEERHQSSYNDEYVFALTRSVSNSTMHPAAKVPLFLFTVPLDIAVFPIEVLAGFF